MGLSPDERNAKKSLGEPPDGAPARPPDASGLPGTLTARQRSALIAYLSFAITALTAQGLAAAVRSGRFAARDVVVRGVHLHHYVPGTSGTLPQQDRGRPRGSGRHAADLDR